MKTSRSIWRVLAVLALLILPLIVMMPALGQGTSRAEAASSTSANLQAVMNSTVPSEALPPGATTQVVLANMTAPIAIAFDPSGRIFYTEKTTGNVRLFANGTLQANPVITFPVNASGEQGLLGIAVDPNFSTNHFVYVYYTNSSPLENRVVRFAENNGVGSGATTIFTSPDDTQCSNHNGGNIHFGLDGKLYIAIGDDGCSPQNSQNVAVTNGKMHRINSDGSIPAGNPVFTQTGALPSLYAMGLRNPFDFAIDPYTPGRIFGSENGPNCDDEMNRIEGGFNYGWRPSYPCDDQSGASSTYNTIQPLWFLPQSTCCEAPTGIEVYSGASVPQWTRDVFMCAYTPGKLYHFVLSADRTTVVSTNVVSGITCNMDVQTGPDGALYYIQGGGYSAGTLIKITGGGTPSPTRTNTATNTPPVTSTPCNCTPTNTSTYTATSTPTRTATSTNTTVASATNINTVVSTATGVPTRVPSSTATVCACASATPTTCNIQFQDVPQTNTFYPFVTCLACRNILGGYPCGSPGEPCGTSGNPYFRPGVNVSRGQIAKIVAQAAAIGDVPGGQIYEDVAPSSPFYTWINQLSNRGYMGGYPCGGPGEPCGQPGNKPYFRPSANATRGQLSKIVSNAAGFNEPASGQTYQDVAPNSTFYLWIERLSSRGVMSGYPCGGPGEPCGQPGNKPYFRPGANVTRGQAAKIVSNTFFPNCQSRVPTATPPPATATTVAATSTSAPATATQTPVRANIVNVIIQNYAYTPATITVTMGTTVRWTNYDLDYHTITSRPGDPVVLDSPHIQQGESFTYTFTEPGTYNYICTPHPYMEGSVIVTP